MSLKKLCNNSKVRRAAAAAIVVALAATPLTACGSQSASSDADSSATASQTVTSNSSGWKTLGDALAAQTSLFSSEYDDKYYVCGFQAGDSFYRVVAKLDAETNQKIDDVDWSKGDADKQIEEAISGLPLQSVEDLTSEMVPQDELDKLVGKTGKDLADAGYTFVSYFMYGGEETGVTFVKGSLAYMFTFDASVPEDKVDADTTGALIADAKVTAVEFSGISDEALDPTKAA